MSDTVRVILGWDYDACAAYCQDPNPIPLADPEGVEPGVYEIPREQYERWQQVMKDWDGMQAEIDEHMKHRQARA